MNRISAQKAKAVLNRLKNVRILVVGDIMLDQYWWGEVSRISPEAPIPVVNVKEQVLCLGGAANVAFNVRSLGGIPLLVGVVGKDDHGRQVVNIARKNMIPTDGIAAVPDRPTTTKTRVIGRSQHLVRADHECTQYLNAGTEGKILETIKNQLPMADAVLIEDYNKGLLSPSLIESIIKNAKKAGKPVTVDPKFTNFFAYKGVTVFKPNFKETEGALGRILDPDDMGPTCREIVKRMQLENLVITLGAKGMVHLTKGGHLSKVPTVARKVYDVSGAGDTVIATLTACLASGSDIHTAVEIANHAAGAVCQELGVVPATPAMILRSFEGD